jgi:hypothetical protein
VKAPLRMLSHCVTRCCALTVALAATTAAGASAQTQSQIRVTPENARVSAYLHELANPGGLAGMAGGAALERLRNRHTEFGEELAFRGTERVVGVSVRHGLAAALHLSTNGDYQLCACRGVGPRVAHALVQSLTDPRDGGGRALAVPRIAATTAQGFTALAWRHDRSVGDVLAGTAFSFGAKALFNIGRELTRIQLHIRRP